MYDLAQFARSTMDERLVRRLWVLKVWGDVVDDDRGTKPLNPSQVLMYKRESDFQVDSLGVLTRPVDIPGWERTVRELDADEQRWAACNPKDRFEVETALAARGFA